MDLSDLLSGNPGRITWNPVGGSNQPIRDILCDKTMAGASLLPEEEAAMENIYADIAARTGGNIYIGVVGPVRTGKSTLIKRIMEEF